MKMLSKNSKEAWVELVGLCSTDKGWSGFWFSTNKAVVAVNNRMVELEAAISGISMLLSRIDVVEPIAHLIEQAEEEIRIFERPSRTTSVTMLNELKIQSWYINQIKEKITSITGVVDNVTK